MKKKVTGLDNFLFIILYVIPLIFLLSIGYMISGLISERYNDILLLVSLPLSFACIWSIAYVRIARKVFECNLELFIAPNILFYYDVCGLFLAIVIMLLSGLLGRYANLVMGIGFILFIVAIIKVVYFTLIKISYYRPKILGILALIFMASWVLALVFN